MRPRLRRILRAVGEFALPWFFERQLPEEEVERRLRVRLILVAIGVGALALFAWWHSLGRPALLD